MSDDIRSRIVELSSKLAEHCLIVKYRVSQDLLFDENGNYHKRFQDEFYILYDEYYDAQHTYTLARD